MTRGNKYLYGYDMKTERENDDAFPCTRSKTSHYL